MLPWSIRRPTGEAETFEAGLGRAIGAFLPAAGVNREKLLGENLSRALVQQIEEDIPSVADGHAAH